MIAHITGMLVSAGDYSLDEQVDNSAPLARVVVVMPCEVLRKVERLPMHEEVTIIRTAELGALRHMLGKAVSLLDTDPTWDEAVYVVSEARALLKGGGL